jgi:acyl-coenzyme A synthetase/AMP-(fatty) acid ligase
MAAFGPVLSQVYGRVEGGWPLSVLGPTDHAAITAEPGLARSCGRPVNGIVTKLRSVEADQAGRGELLVRGATTSPEYTDADGWCALGDVMIRDQKGYLYFDGRLDRMINTGYHIYPEEVENAIVALGGVKACLVRGEPHPRWGQMVVAYVVADLSTQRDLAPDRMLSILSGKLAKYNVPREIRIVDHLPVGT